MLTSFELRWMYYFCLAAVSPVSGEERWLCKALHKGQAPHHVLVSCFKLTGEMTWVKPLLLSVLCEAVLRKQRQLEGNYCYGICGSGGIFLRTGTIFFFPWWTFSWRTTLSASAWNNSIFNLLSWCHNSMYFPKVPCLVCLMIDLTEKPIWLIFKIAFSMAPCFKPSLKNY